MYNWYVLLHILHNIHITCKVSAPLMTASQQTGIGSHHRTPQHLVNVEPKSWKPLVWGINITLIRMSLRKWTSPKGADSASVSHGFSL